MDHFGSALGKTLILTGCLIVVVGVVVTFGAKIPWLDKLPGNIYIKRGNFTLYFPLTTCIILSILLTLVLRFLKR